MTQRIQNPYPIFIDLEGNLLDGGKVYIGAANADPETSPIQVYKDQGLTITLDQPLTVLGGFIVDGANASFAYVSPDNYSIRIRDINDVEVIYLTSVALASTPYQPLDADLTAIAALATTAYGRALLTLANQAALQAAVGLPAALPLAGGTMTGNILRSGAGGHAYAASSSYPSVRMFFPTVGDPDPSSQPGDLVFWLSA